MSSDRKTVLFFPLNSPGHINSSLGVANRIRQDYGHRTVFLLLGQMIGDSIREHGHELVILDEANPYEDYEIEDGEDTSEPVGEEVKRRQGKTKKKFEGAHKWPQIISRNKHLSQLDPLEAFVKGCEVMERCMVGELMDNHQNYAAAIERIQPDLIVIDAYYIPPCVVKLKHIPWVRLYSANPLVLLNSLLPDGVKPVAMCGFKLYNKGERERMRREEPSKWQAMLDEWRQATAQIFAAMDKAGAVLQDFLVKEGCEPLPLGQQAHNSPHLNVYMFPVALDYDQDTDLFEYPKRWFRCDSLMRKQATAADSPEIRHWAQQLDTHLVNKDAIIYFSLGSLASGQSELMQRYVEMLKYDKRRLYVVSKGVNGDKFDLCQENMIGANYIPQTFFLQRANLAIIHGGNNSVTECCFYGLPMIVLPVFADQLDNAQRIEDLGMGRRLNVNQCTREELTHAIDEVLRDRTMIERMRQVGQAMQRRDDLSKLVPMLNKLAEKKTLTDEDIEAMS